MKKIVTVLWHNSANRLNMLKPQTDKFVHLKVYSAAALRVASLIPLNSSGNSCL